MISNRQFVHFDMIRSHRELRVYKAAFGLATDLFEASKRWPVEERYALTDQVRRSSRSVCANLAESWAKRMYPRHFVSKISDAEGEALETQTWIDFAADAGYLSERQAAEFYRTLRQIIGSLVKMRTNPAPWCLPQSVQEDVAHYDA